ncbi:MAG: YncE family protein, partial [Planctomycetota bacterium]
QSTPIPGRGFIGGRTYAGIDPNTPGRLRFERWVELDVNGKPIAASVDLDANCVPDGKGFPGTESTISFTGASKLVSDNVFVFVVDTDGNLATHERFPVDRQIRLRATTALRAVNQNQLLRQVVASATVGADGVEPEVLTTPAPNSIPLTSPSFGDVDVDPLTTIQVEFTEPVQPTSVGSFPTVRLPIVSPAITLVFGPTNQQTQVPYTCMPLSVFDLSKWVLTTQFGFPGNGPASQGCGTFNRVTMTFVPAQVRDLRLNVNTLGATTDFTTGEGPGLVNAPVAPEAILVGRVGAVPSISVIDLNGFGQSTGDPQFDFSYQTFPKGWSNFPNNPNLIQYGPTMFPPLFPGTCTVDGGSAGAFTLTRDSSLSDQLVRAPLITSVGEMALGNPLDTVYHNGKDSTGCRFNGGNFCSINGKKVIRTSFQTSQTIGPPLPNQAPAAIVPGGANPISFAPHPNPPPLRFPPLCLQPFIGGEEPTSIYTATAPPAGLGFANLLVPGNPLREFDRPPTGIGAQFQNAFFEGPDRVTLTSSGPCLEHQYRQQIGHFLYMLDRARREVVVFNSNRMTVLDRIPCADPTDITMAPNLDFIAVSNQNADTVTFIDTHPASATFHKVVKVTQVGRGPRGIEWDPGNEDILVCNEEDGSVSILSAFTFDVRKTIFGNLERPFDVVILQRQIGFGYNRAVYFAWILNRNGDLTIFESGPNGVNGWGYDDTVGVAPFTFENPKKLALNYEFVGGSVWILHENPLSETGTPTGQIGGAVTRVDIDSGAFGLLPLNGFQGQINPQFRNMSLKVRTSIGPNELTGVPVDLCFDELNNLGASQNTQSNFGVGQGILINGKSVIRNNTNAAIFPDYMFLAVPTSSEGPGVIDVISMTSGYARFDTDKYLTGVQSVPCSGARFLCTFFRH